MKRELALLTFGHFGAALVIPSSKTVPQARFTYFAFVPLASPTQPLFLQASSVLDATSDATRNARAPQHAPPSLPARADNAS